MNFKKYKSFIILIISIILGVIIGSIFKEKAMVIKPLGDIFLNLMFTIVVPLIFFTVTSSIASMESFKKLASVLKWALIVFVVTSFVSALVMFITLKLTNFNPNLVLDGVRTSEVDIPKQIVGLFTVNDFSNLFSRSNIMPLIIFSVLFGIALKKVKADSIIEKINTLSKVFMQLVKIIMLYAPIGLCAYFASLVGEYGTVVSATYLKSIIIYFIVSILYMLIFYTIYSYISGGIVGVKKFWKSILPSIFTSLATQSSLATLPVNMDVADDLSISKDVAKISLPLASTMHMEGSSMGAVLKIMFIFSILNINLTPFNIVLMFVIAILSAVVMAGIPAGGLIGEALIVSMFGFPAEAFIPIATIGILIDAPATMLNATGDIASALLIDKFSKER